MSNIFANQWFSHTWSFLWGLVLGLLLMGLRHRPK